MNNPSHYFLAVPLPNEVKSGLWSWARLLKEHTHYKTWTGEADYHITLIFFGAIAEEKIERLTEGLTSIVNELEPMALALNGLDGFGKNGHPRVLYASVMENQALIKNQRRIADICRQCGFPVENRPYRPHITLGKKWVGRQPISIPQLQEHLPTLPVTRWHAEEIVLYEIHPGQYPKYLPVKTFYFGNENRVDL